MENPQTKVIRIPCGEYYAAIPYPLEREDFDLLLATLTLWTPTLVRKPVESEKPQPEDSHE